MATIVEQVKKAIHQQEIAAQVEEVTARLKDAQLELLRLQAYCTHPNAKKVPRADTGNWCKADDSYWYECSCADCGKKWTEDQ